MSADIPENPTFLSGEFRYTNAIPVRFMACWRRSDALFARQSAIRGGYELEKKPRQRYWSVFGENSHLNEKLNPQSRV